MFHLKGSRKAVAGLTGKQRFKFHCFFVLVPNLHAESENSSQNKEQNGDDNGRPSVVSLNRGDYGGLLCCYDFIISSPHAS